MPAKYQPTPEELEELDYLEDRLGEIKEELEALLARLDKLPAPRPGAES